MCLHSERVAAYFQYRTKEMVEHSLQSTCYHTPEIDMESNAFAFKCSLSSNYICKFKVRHICIYIHFKSTRNMKYF